jgi:hypothetical protein
VEESMVDERYVSVYGAVGDGRCGVGVMGRPLRLSQSSRDEAAALVSLTIGLPYPAYFGMSMGWRGADEYLLG